MLGFLKKLYQREDENSKSLREKRLMKYIYNTEYFKELSINQKLFDNYYERPLASKDELNHSIEICIKTMVIESMRKTFKVQDLIEFLGSLTNDIYNNGTNAKVSEIIGWFQQNMMLYFLNETKAEGFVQEYFIEDCFRLVCNELALKNITK